MTAKRPNIKSKNRFRTYRGILHGILEEDLLERFLENTSVLKRKYGEGYLETAKFKLSRAVTSSNPQDIAIFIHEFISDIAWNTLTNGNLNKIRANTNAALKREKKISDMANNATKDGYEPK